MGTVLLIICFSFNLCGLGLVCLVILFVRFVFAGCLIARVYLISVVCWDFSCYCC